MIENGSQFGRADHRIGPEDRSEELRIASETRQLEINLFWHRSLFFWGFIAAAAIGYFQVFDDSGPLTTGVACFGMVCSFVWTLGNRGGKFWQVNWEKKADDAAASAIGKRVFDEIQARDESGFVAAKRFSPSALAVALSDFVFLLWAAAVGNQVLLAFGIRASTQAESIVSVVIASSSLYYLFYIYSAARRRMPRESGVDV